jgi:hypothetical protein
MIKNSNEGNYYMNINWQRANNELFAMQAKLLEAIENEERYKEISKKVPSEKIRFSTPESGNYKSLLLEYV